MLLHYKSLIVSIKMPENAAMTRTMRSIELLRLQNSRALFTSLHVRLKRRKAKQCIDIAKAGSYSFF